MIWESVTILALKVIRIIPFNRRKLNKKFSGTSTKIFCKSSVLLLVHVLPFVEPDYLKDTDSYAKFPNDAVSDKAEVQKMSGAATILELVHTKDTQKALLQVNIDPLLNILSEIGNREVAIVSIVGKPRSGKSFLVNQLIKYLKYNEVDKNWIDKHLDNEFEWRGDFERQTSGIQVWHEPIHIRLNGKETSVIILHTQGLHDKNTGAQENAIILGVSILLSSVLIFNEKYVADDSLQYIRSYLDLSNFATTCQNDRSAENLIFQKLILLIRDFHADEFAFGYYDDNNSPIDQISNLKKTIFDVTSDMYDTEAVKTRLAVVNCFEEIGAYAMSSPGSRLPNKYTESRNWDPNFLHTITDFVSKLFSPASIQKSRKRIFGSEVTGEQLQEYVSKWAKLLEATEGFAQSKVFFETTVEIFYMNKMEESLYKYETSMKQQLDSNPSGIPFSELNQFHELLVKSIVGGLSSNNRVLVGTSIMEKLRKKLLERWNWLKNIFISYNKAKLDAEEQRQLRKKEIAETQLREDELALQRKASKELAITVAESQYKQALEEWRIAKRKLQHVITNQHSYKSPVEKKKKHNLLGITYRKTKYTEWEYNDGLFREALQMAHAEVNRMQKVVNAAEDQFNMAKSY